VNGISGGVGGGWAVCQVDGLRWGSGES
jgi:hypothetical protein